LEQEKRKRERKRKKHQPVTRPTDTLSQRGEGEVTLLSLMGNFISLYIESLFIIILLSENTNFPLAPWGEGVT
jgi:hypothetical protein